MVSRKTSELKHYCRSYIKGFKIIKVTILLITLAILVGCGVDNSSSLIDNEKSVRDIKNITNISRALKNGNSTEVSTEEIYQTIANSADSNVQKCKKLLQQIYPNGLVKREAIGIEDISYFDIRSFGWIPVIVAYNNGNPEIYLAVKEFKNGTRVAISSIPLFNEQDMKDYFSDGKDKTEILNILKWLAHKKGENNNGFKTDNDFLNSPLKILWHDGVSGWIYHGGWSSLWRFDKWIKANYSNAGVTLDSNGLPQNWSRDKGLPSVVNNPSKYDIFMINDAKDADIQKVFDMSTSGDRKGLFIHITSRHAYNNHNTLTGTNAGWYFRTQKTYGDAPNFEKQCKSNQEQKIAKLVYDLKDSNFNYTFPDYNGDTMATQNGRWNTILVGDNKKITLKNITDNNDGQTLAKKLFDKLETLSLVIREQFDYKKIDIFADNKTTTNRLLKLYLLLADKYRQDISYPMDKVDTDNTTFFKALFADNAVSYLRTTNAYQPKLGAFLNHDSNIKSWYNESKYANNKILHEKETIGKHIDIKITKFTEATATGLYAPSGKEFNITRTDTNANVVAYIRIGFTRLGSGIESTNTMPFSYKNNYDRPQVPTSHWIKINSGETLHLSTPYGGTLNIEWEAQEDDNKPTISFDFKGVLQNPMLYLDGTETKAQKQAKIDTFEEQINQNNGFSWYDIKTPFAEVHTMGANFNYIVSQPPYNGNVEKYIYNLNHYLILNTYHWAGFTGGGLNPLNPSVVNFCNEHNLDCTSSTINQKPKIQHLNSDSHALCGNGCAGNPIDFNIAIDPLAQLPNHEMGHNLQRARMTLTHGSEVSNLIVPMHTSRSYALDQGNENFSGWDQLILDFNASFDALKNELINNNTLVTNKGPGHEKMRGMAFYAQLMWSSDKNETIAWDFYTKMWLHERIFNDAISDKNNQNDNNYWQTKRDNLGFSDYSIDEAKNINSIDYMAITTSLITNRDYSDYFEMWLLQVSDKAKAQIINNDITVTEPREYLFIDQAKRSDIEGNTVNKSRYGSRWWVWWKNPQIPLAWPVHHLDTWIDMSDPSTAEYKSN